MRVEWAGNLYSLLLLFISVLASVQRGFAACDLEGAMRQCGQRQSEAARGRCFRTFDCEDALRRLSSGMGKRGSFNQYYHQRSSKRNDDVLQLNQHTIDNLLDEFSTLAETNKQLPFDENDYRPINNPILTYFQQAKIKRQYKQDDEADQWL
ncbi:uncharacterized protein [Amphiura filiformis]|uniref:uncharacterized protein isoform X2 n=1 Tax=Amphiura filiformis TaxID=82378 RepID=UPI003B2139B1